MSIATWIVPNTIAATCLALLVAGACRFGRLSPAVRHALWLVVLLKLVTPPFIDIPLAVPQCVLDFSPMRPISVELTSVPSRDDSRRRDPSEMLPSEGLAPADFDSVDYPMQSPTGDVDAGLPLVEMDESTFTATASADASPLPANGSEPGPVCEARPGTGADSRWERTAPSVWLTWLWCAGSGIFAAIQLRRIVNLRRQIDAGRSASAPLQELVSQEAAELGVRAPRLRIVPNLLSPALCAWGRVSLLWPEGRLDHFSTAGRRAVVIHELAHLKRRDHWVGWIELLAGCGWWWNPLFWYVRHQLHENAELACDAWVVARLPDGRRAYAEALIDVAQGEPVMQLSGVVLGVGDGSRRLLERRLVMIMRGGVRYQIPVVGLAVIALVAVATLPRWSIANSVESRLSVSVAEVQSENSVVGTGADPRVDEQSGPIAESADLLVTWTDATADAGIEESRPIAAPVAHLVGASLEPTDLESVTNDTVLNVPDAQGDLITVVSGGVTVETGNVTVETNDAAFIPERRMKDVAASPSTAIRETTSHDDHAARLSRVEAQLGSLLKELRELKMSRPSERTGTSRPAMTGLAPAAGIIVHGPPAILTMSGKTPPSKPAGIQPTGTYTVHRDRGGALSLVQSENSAVETVSMVRTTYKLPKGRAESLARSLAGELNDDIEIKLKGDSLQVTASHDDQQAIGHLILLIQRRGKTSANAPKTDTFDDNVRYSDKLR